MRTVRAPGTRFAMALVTTQLEVTEAVFCVKNQPRFDAPDRVTESDLAHGP
jgi:hypothetical protein